jgi:hypothetical protein
MRGRHQQSCRCTRARLRRDTGTAYGKHNKHGNRTHAHLCVLPQITLTHPHTHTHIYTHLVIELSTVTYTQPGRQTLTDRLCTTHLITPTVQRRSEAGEEQVRVRKQTGEKAESETKCRPQRGSTSAQRKQQGRREQFICV